MSKVQFNLLPDTKMQRIKTSHSQRLVASICMIIAGISVGVFLLVILTVYGVQKKQLSDASRKIDQVTQQLKDVNGLDQVLTVQNQLQTLVTLHQNKHISSRIFTYLPQITPVNAKITHLSLDYAANTMTVDGTADSQHTVNTFIDTLKFTTFKINDKDTARSAFSAVVERSFSLNPGGASFSLTMQFDPQLFANNLKDSSGKSATPKLTVPKLTTTRSALEDPANGLFNGTSSPAATGQGG